MFEFFRGWRRKIGCVTLMMALALTGVWLRSENVADEIRFTIGQRRHLIMSRHEKLSWWGWNAGDATEFYAPYMSRKLIPIPRENRLPRGAFNGSAFREGPSDLTWALFDIDDTGTFEVKMWMLPHWQIALMLASISAYLLFSKPPRAICSRCDAGSEEADGSNVLTLSEPAMEDSVHPMDGEPA